MKALALSYRRFFLRNSAVYEFCKITESIKLNNQAIF